MKIGLSLCKKKLNPYPLPSFNRTTSNFKGSFDGRTGPVELVVAVASKATEK